MIFYLDFMFVKDSNQPIPVGTLNLFKLKHNNPVSLTTSDQLSQSEPEEYVFELCRQSSNIFSINLMDHGRTNIFCIVNKIHCGKNQPVKQIRQRL